MQYSQEKAPLHIINQELFRQLSLDYSVSTSTVYSIVEALWQIEHEFHSMENRVEECRTKSRIDVKTGLLKYDDNHFINMIKYAARFVREKTDFSVGMIRFDIDDFSRFNNRYGHEAGDAALKVFADFLRQYSRPTDLLVRFGGEEIDVILPSTDRDGVQEYLTKIYSAMTELTVHSEHDRIDLRASAGATVIGCVIEPGRQIKSEKYAECYKKAQREADNALYESKYYGKNRYSIFDPNKEELYENCRKSYIRC